MSRRPIRNWPIRLRSWHALIGFVFSPFKSGIILIFPFGTSVYLHSAMTQIGFVFSNSISQYASRSTQNEINWLCFFKQHPFVLFKIHSTALRACPERSWRDRFRASCFEFPAKARRIGFVFSNRLFLNLTLNSEHWTIILALFFQISHELTPIIPNNLQKIAFFCIF